MRSNIKLETDSNTKQSSEKNKIPYLRTLLADGIRRISNSVINIGPLFNSGFKQSKQVIIYHKVTGMPPIQSKPAIPEDTLLENNAQLNSNPMQEVSQNNPESTGFLQNLASSVMEGINSVLKGFLNIIPTGVLFGTSKDSSKDRKLPEEVPLNPNHAEENTERNSANNEIDDLNRNSEEQTLEIITPGHSSDESNESSMDLPPSPLGPQQAVVQ